MKAGLLTIHVGHNFGSNLQTIASCCILKEIGVEPIVINYVPERVTAATYWKEAVESPKRFIRRLIAAPNFYINKYIYENFLSKHCIVSEPIYDDDNFIEKCPCVDVYITGSDQVWNSKHNRGFNGRYYFEGFPSKSKIISFSSSFGVESLPESEFLKVKDLLKRYRSISVREHSAKQLIDAMGIASTQLLDPTLLLDKCQWMQYMSKRIVNDHYLLLYIPYNVTNKRLLYRTARRIAKQKSLKLITFSWDFRREPLADKTIRYANPGDFLSLMFYADYVITNSFHGTAFSINLNKKFVVFMPSGFGTRIRSILSLCKLENRLVNNEESASVIDIDINYDIVNEILCKERNRALLYLKQSLL